MSQEERQKFILFIILMFYDHKIVPLNFGKSVNNTVKDRFILKKGKTKVNPSGTLS